ncbi:hypothetical protein GCM10027288_08860 [Bordetella tumbae]
MPAWPENGLCVRREAVAQRCLAPGLSRDGPTATPQTVAYRAQAPTAAQK